MSTPAATPQPQIPDGPKDRLASEFTRILTWRYGAAEPQVVAALILAAGQFAARRVEECARPDDRWGPR